MNELHALQAISPVDGRYASTTQAASDYFSEAALIRYRIKVETLYLLHLNHLQLPKGPSFSPDEIQKINHRLLAVSLEDCLRVKHLEKTTNHDVKAVEYFMREVLKDLGFQEQPLAFIHFGLTSQDINNTAVPLALKDFFQQELSPRFEALLETLKDQAKALKDIPMLARTHGQAASPTRLGKEWMVFVERLQSQWERLKTIPFQCKLGGATGNLNAHHIAYPEIAWDKEMNHFCLKDLGLNRQQFTTQIEHYDMLAAFCDAWKRMAVILVDFARDVWQYISMDYFKQQVVAGEVGSSAMPHKVNPIDFENAEGNLLWAIQMLEFFPQKLPISRLQRDLTDSTVLRNLGMPFAHLLIAFSSLQKGLKKIKANEEKIGADLALHAEVLAEAVQTILRREGIYDGYERLKEFSRTGSGLDLDKLRRFIAECPLSQETKEWLLSLEPKDYTGLNLMES